MIPFGDKLRDYFHKYESGSRTSTPSLRRCSTGRTSCAGQRRARPGEGAPLGDDGSAWRSILRAEHRDKALEAKIAESRRRCRQGEGAARRRALRGRQKHQDLLTQLAVSIQGYWRSTWSQDNLELIKASTARRRPPSLPCGPR